MLDNVADLSAAAVQHGTTIECLVEIDCGAGRCGAKTTPEVLALAKAVAAAPGLPVIYGRTDVNYVKCSDEHGVVEDPAGVLKVNDKLKLVPGHCDPTCNVHDWYVGVRNGVVEMVWPVSARGKAY
jgi:3-hydroxy-D-aspartate aldolase